MQSQKIHKIELKYVDESDPRRKTVDYIATLKVLSNNDEIDGLIIPYKSDISSDYNIENINHQAFQEELLI